MATILFSKWAEVEVPASPLGQKFPANPSRGNFGGKVIKFR